jgi:hypothetical protein
MTLKRILFGLNAAIIIGNIGDSRPWHTLATAFAVVACLILADDSPRGWRL